MRALRGSRAMVNDAAQLCRTVAASATHGRVNSPAPSIKRPGHVGAPSQHRRGQNKRRRTAAVSLSNAVTAGVSVWQHVVAALVNGTTT